MAIKNFPNVNPDANATFGLESNTSEFRSVLSNDVQHMSLPGDRWVGSVSFTNRTRSEANKVKAFKASLGGSAGRFYFTPVDAYQAGTMGGSGVIDGAVASGASSLPTSGWTADQDTLFEAGDYLEVNGELKMVTDDVTSDGTGAANIPIAPPLRRALAGGEAITTTEPKGVFYLGSNSQEWSINVNGVHNMGFDFVEDVN